MAAPAQTAKLIRDYEQARGKPGQETVAIHCLRHLFGILGWQDENKTSNIEAPQIVDESALRLIVPEYEDARLNKLPPAYSLRINDERKCFVATFTPSNDSAFHLRRYAWSANLPISILSNFEELRIYNGLCRPRNKDSADTALIERIGYKDYERRWDDLNKYLSASRLEKDVLESIVQPRSFRRWPVDEAFLQEIEGWRWDLAKSIDRCNPRISLEDLNAAVQHTMNGILFLRICEDRGIEPYGRLQQISVEGNVFDKLKTQFAHADSRYNAGIFRLNKDLLGATFAIDDSDLRQIIQQLYYPKSPYEFSVIGVELLGSVYERFLRNIITRTRDGQIAIIENPEVGKSGGVYYTPARVAKILVNSTLGKLCEGKTPEQALELQVLDPSCGSGSFLNAAYQYLLNWHRGTYLQDREKYGSFLHRNQLTMERRKEILTKNIFGVDLDAQAIEVAKLSLLLNVLEGETPEPKRKQATLVKDLLLPNLDRNLQCGNSLLGPDFKPYQSKLSAEEQSLYQPFNFKKQFPLAFHRKEPGFDAVIGNPPYISYAGRQAIPLPEPLRQYFSSAYHSSAWPCAHGLFIERSAAFLSRGMVAFIVPDTVGKVPLYGCVREALLRHSKLVEVLYWGDGVFKGVTMPTLTFVADRGFDGPTKISREDHRCYEEVLRGNAPWDTSLARSILNRITNRSFFLGDLVADLRAVAGEGKQTILQWPNNESGAIAVLEGKDIQRYQCTPPRNAILPDANHLALLERAKPRYEQATFLIRNTADRLIAGPHRHTTYFRNSLLALYASEGGWPDQTYIVALMNSRLMHFLWREQVPEARQRTFAQVKVTPLRKMPFLKVNPGIPEDKAFHDEIVRVVAEILELYQTLPDQIFGEQQRTEQRIAFLDDYLDRLIDCLYGLSDREIADIKRELGLKEVSDADINTLNAAPDEPYALLDTGSDILWERLRRGPRDIKYRACLKELTARRDPALGAYIAARLEEPALDAETRNALIYAALDTQCFERESRERLQKALLARARELLNSGNEPVIGAALRRAAAMTQGPHADVLLDFLADSVHADTRFTALECIQNIFLVDFPETSPAVEALRSRVREICAGTLDAMTDESASAPPAIIDELIAKASFCAAAALLDPNLPELSIRLASLNEPYLKRSACRFLKELEGSWQQRHAANIEEGAHAVLALAMNQLQPARATLNQPAHIANSGDERRAL